MEAYELNTKGLDQLLKALKGKQPVGRIGILGQNAVRGGGTSAATLSNAAVGAMHEFGTSKLPQRSFLRIPIMDNLNKRLEAAGALTSETLNAVVATGSFIPWLKKVVVVAEGIVLEAFDTGGFGKWKPSDMAKKKNHQTLVETQQLRNSVTSEVVE